MAGAPGTRITVRLTPRAARDEVGVPSEGVLPVRVTTPPVDGAANEALVRLLARRLRVPKGAVHIVSGATARSKVVAIEGLDAAEVERRLASS